MKQKIMVFFFSLIFYLSCSCFSQAHGKCKILPERLFKIFPKVTFIFVRHGDSGWDPSMLSQGPLNLALNEAGRKQAKNAASFLKRFSFYGTVYTSPLKRAYQTAEVIGKALAQDIKIVQNLKERYFGDWSKRPQEAKDLSRKAKKDLTYLEKVVTKEWLPEDAEKLEDFKQRVKNVFAYILRSQEDKLLIIVSHEEVFKSLTCMLTGQQQRIGQGEMARFRPPSSKTRGQLWRIDRLK